MTTYSFIDESGETRLVGTISPAPGGGSQAFMTIGPVPVTFASAGLNATGFPICNVLEGDIVCGWGGACSVGFDHSYNLGLYVGDNSGVLCVDSGSNSFANPSGGDAGAVTMTEVFDGWTLILADASLVLAAQGFDPDFPMTVGAVDIYVTLLRPVAP